MKEISKLCKKQFSPIQFLQKMQTELGVAELFVNNENNRCLITRILMSIRGPVTLIFESTNDMVMKNIQKRLAIALIAGLPMLMGCFDFEFPVPDLSGFGSFSSYDGGYGGYGGGYPTVTISEMNMDSAALINDSTMLFWASLHFAQDTVLFVQRYDLIWCELVEVSPGSWAGIWPVSKVNTSMVNDTIDFKSNNMKPFVITVTLPVDSLKTNTYYAFNPGGNYTTPDEKSGAFSGKTLMKKIE